MNEAQVTLFKAKDFDLSELSQTLTKLKGQATRTPTPVTVEQLEDIDSSPTSLLFLLQSSNERKVLGMIHANIIHLEDRAHIGPLSVDSNVTSRGYGTKLMEEAVSYIKDNFPDLRRIDLTNRPGHDLSGWYQKFGFVARTEENSDPSIIYRLKLK